MSVLWQACPVCRGSGVDPHPPANALSCATTPCRVCAGTRLVSVVTGKPPRLRTAADALAALLDGEGA